MTNTNNKHSMIKDWSLVNTITPTMITKLYQAIDMFIEPHDVPSTLIDCVKLADDICVIWANLDDEAINHLSPLYYDGLKSEQGMFASRDTFISNK